MYRIWTYLVESVKEFCTLMKTLSWKAIISFSMIIFAMLMAIHLKHGMDQIIAYEQQRTNPLRHGHRRLISSGRDNHAKPYHPKGHPRRHDWRYMTLKPPVIGQTVIDKPKLKQMVITGMIDPKANIEWEIDYSGYIDRGGDGTVFECKKMTGGIDPEKQYVAKVIKDGDYAMQEIYAMQATGDKYPTSNIIQLRDWYRDEDNTYYLIMDRVGRNLDTMMIFANLPLKINQRR